MKLHENIEHIRFALNKIKPGKATISINETDIVIVATDRRLGRTPGIQKYNLKRIFNYTTRLRKQKLMTDVGVTLRLPDIELLCSGSRWAASGIA